MSSWHPQDTPQTRRLRHELVQRIKTREQALQSPGIEAAFETVPRHVFLPNDELDQVYSDVVITTKVQDNQAISSSSQPTMMAIMLEQLALEPGMKVLEIGAGTGYNAALMAHIVGPQGHITSIDIDQDLVDAARQHLHDAQVGNVTVVCADGAYGYTQNAPYDRIILTVAAWDICPAWRQQLKADGRMVLPLVLKAGAQVSTALVRRGASLESLNMAACRFMPLRGDSAVPESWRKIALAKELNFYIDTQSFDAGGNERQLLMDLLRQPGKLLHSGITVSMNEFYQLALWIELHEGTNVRAFAEGDLVKKKVIPCFIGSSAQYCNSMGMLAAQGMALWACRNVESRGAPADPEGQRYELTARAYGSAGVEIGQQLMQLARSWHENGRPDSEQLRVAVWPLDAPPPEGQDVSVLLRDTVMILVWYA